jgi:hypothetical protein
MGLPMSASWDISNADLINYCPYFWRLISYGYCPYFWRLISYGVADIRTPIIFNFLGFSVSYLYQRDLIGMGMDDVCTVLYMAKAHKV